MLHYMMVELGFTSICIDWMMNCISIVSYSMLINRKVTLPLKARKGLRQGYLLSSFLFTLWMEYLSRCMSTLQYNIIFHCHPRCKRVRQIHLLVACDLSLFCRADIQSIQAIFAQFSRC